MISDIDLAEDEHRLRGAFYIYNPLDLRVYLHHQK